MLNKIIQIFKKPTEDRFFILLANERTGSTATMRLINGHPDVCGSAYDVRIFTDTFTWEGLLGKALIDKLDFNINEFYRELDKTTLLTFLKFFAVKNKKVPVKDSSIHGVKSTFYGASVAELENTGRVLKDMDGRVKIIHLTRDYYESFVSYLIDKKTGRGEDATEEERLETLNTRISFTEEYKAKYTNNAKERDAIMRSLSSYCPYLHVDYTNLYNSTEQGAKEIFKFLELSSSNAVVELAIQNLNRQKKRLTMPIEHYIEEKEGSAEK